MSEELEKSMYFGASPSTFQKAKLLRNKMTPEEKLLWEKLKNKQLCKLRFRRQHPIGTYIADFYCHAALLVVEIDGKIHLQQKEEDQNRTIEIESFGIKVVRFTNEEIKVNMEQVIQQITQIVESRLKDQSLI
jgi:very-short-patch-repair endonuclease